MIKAEIITEHDTNKVDWITRSKSAISPLSVLLTFVLVAVIALFVNITINSDSTTKTTPASQQSDSDQSLQVRQAPATYQASDGNTTVQAANGATRESSTGTIKQGSQQNDLQPSSNADAIKALDN